MSKKKIIFLIISLLCFTNLFIAQEPYSIQFTSENGLPGNEIYCAYQDTSGFIWFGTDNGISRYDGYTFENFGIKNGLDILEINKIIEDSNGKIWFSSYFGKVYSWDGKYFKPYRWNHVLTKYKKRSNLVNLHHIDDENTFFFQVNQVGILMIYKNGKHEFITADCGNCELILNTKNGQIINESVLNKNHINFKSEEYDISHFGKRMIYFKDLKQQKEIRRKLENEFISSNSHQTIKYNDSLSLFSLYKKTYKIYQGIISPVMISPAPINIYFKDGEDLYLGHKENEGLHIYRNLTSNWKTVPEKWLKGSEVSWIFRDRNQGLWVTTINNGIFYFPNDKVKVFNNKEKGKFQKIIAVFPTGKGKAIATDIEGDILWIENYELNHKIIINRKVNTHDITRNADFTFIRKTHVHNRSYKTLEHSNVPSRFERKWKLENFYGSERNYLYKFNTGTNEFDLVLDVAQNSDFIWDMFRDHKNTLWLATNGGLKTFSDNKIKEVVPQLQKIKTTAIDQLKNGLLVVGTKGNGLFILDNSNKILANITSTEGLTSDLIENVWVDDADNIWAATLNGLNKIIFTNDKNFKIKHFHRSHGLPTEEIFMVRAFGTDIWLATGKGLVLFKEESIENQMMIPYLISIIVNDKDNFKNILNHNENNIHIVLKNYDFAIGNQVRYRYRLNNHSDWVIQSGNTINIINIRPDNYLIEIQAENKDGLWSESLRIPFKIKKPWWKSGFFIICMGSILSLLSFGYYRYRIKAIQKIQDIKNQMLIFEKKALLSQMNPHFIFNAFSAIQYYINTNNVKKADDFLTDFSYLIRKILDNSNKKDILLSDELKLLKLYTSLEERRFGHKFSIIFQIDDEIDTDATRIPAMLIQPLIENAINHGLMPLKERKGKLNIYIEDDDGALIIHVEDNGVGIQYAKNKVIDKEHSSYGLKLIQDRIASYKNSREYDISLIQSDLFENDKPAGSRFSLAIRQFGI